MSINNLGDNMICSFFGHRSIPKDIGELIKKSIADLIEAEPSDITFYVGNKGGFDRVVQYSLAQLREKYPEIKVFVVLDYLPVEKDNYFNLPTIMPDGFERVPKRFAMSHRNKWMIEQCDLAIVYCENIPSNTRKYIEMLKRKEKAVINIADMVPFFLDNPDFIC